MLKLLLWLLKRKKLSQQSRALILNTLLERVQALPLRDLITYDLEGTVRVNGKSLDKEQIIMLREGAVALEKNWAYKLIRDQLTYEAIKMGIHSSLSLDMVLMSKSVLWVIQNEKKIIQQLSGEIDNQE